MKKYEQLTFLEPLPKKPLTQFVRLKKLSINKLAEWMVENCRDDCEWAQWVDKNYCQKCKKIKIPTDSFGFKIEQDYAPCEIEQCPYGIAELNTVDLIKLWLNSEVEE